MKLSAIFLGLLLIIGVTGCASDAYRIARASCESEGYSRFPQQLYQHKEQTSEMTMGNTGQVNCTTSYMGSYADTTCKPQQGPVFVPREVITTRDANASNRNSWISSCARSKCFSSHGNAGCE